MVADFVPQVCSQSSLTKAIKVLEERQCTDAAPTLLAALDTCKGIEVHVRGGLRLRLNMAAGQLGAAARDALEVARREQVRVMFGRELLSTHAQVASHMLPGRALVFADSASSSSVLGHGLQ